MSVRNSNLRQEKAGCAANLRMIVGAVTRSITYGRNEKNTLFNVATIFLTSSSLLVLNLSDADLGAISFGLITTLSSNVPANASRTAASDSVDVATLWKLLTTTE